MHAFATPPDRRAGISTRVAADLFANASRVVKGKPDQIRLALAVLLGGGHLLIEDIPGVGKTLLAKSLARSIGGTFRRIQGTPDLLPADLTGVSVYKRSTEAWEFRQGPLFANVVLVDEINRATPRAQAALLEAMEEQQVTVDGTSHRLPDPFFVIATQNPFEHAGTFQLVEGQRDRFAALMQLGLPDRKAERSLLQGAGGGDELEKLAAVATLEEIEQSIEDVRSVHCDESVIEYVLDILTATRNHPDIRLGASTRAGLAVMSVARGHAAVQARDYVSPDDVKTVATAVLAHRIILTIGHDLDAAEEAVADVLGRVASP